MNIPVDKQAHFWWGWATAATVFPLGFWLALFCPVLLGFAKEYWDSKGHGTPDGKDFLATAFGGIVGATVCLIIGALHG